jgi:hypothetical protein
MREKSVNPILAGKGSDQLPHIRNTDASDHVIAGTSAESTICSGGDISEARSPNQRVKSRIEKRQLRLSRIDAGLIDQSAKAGPDRGTPARSTNLDYLAANAPPYFVPEVLKAYDADSLGVTGNRQTIAILIDTFPCRRGPDNLLAA